MCILLLLDGIWINGSPADLPAPGIELGSSTLQAVSLPAELWMEFSVYIKTVVLCLVAQLCLTHHDPIDCSLPGFSVYGISPGENTGVGFHALLQESSQPRDGAQVSCTVGGFFTIWATSPLRLVDLTYCFLSDFPWKTLCCQWVLMFPVTTLLSLSVFSCLIFPLYI